MVTHKNCNNLLQFQSVSKAFAQNLGKCLDNKSTLKVWLQYKLPLHPLSSETGPNLINKAK